MLVLAGEITAADGERMGTAVLAVSESLGRLKIAAAGAAMDELEQAEENPDLPSLDWDNQPLTRDGEMRLVAECAVGADVRMAFEITEVEVV